MTSDERRFPTHGVVTYRTTTAALRSEQILTSAGYAVRIVDVPRSLASDCCQGLRILWADREEIAQALDGAGVPYVAILAWPG
ncbi:MAG: DUF3343 domain-containing protein [Anaerolineae bacterium]|nr:DUF3343 domain-containing protein [Anaerolineae bacterium]